MEILLILCSQSCQLASSTLIIFMCLRRLCERNADCCHWSWSKGGDKKCWLKMMKLSVVPASESNHVSGSKICTNQCEPGVCWEHARYPGGSGGDASMEHVANTFHECRWGKQLIVQCSSTRNHHTEYLQDGNRKIYSERVAR